VAAADIDEKLKQDFGSDVDRAKELLDDLDVGTKRPISDRLVRAILYLAAGDVERLARVIETARIDYRDVLWQAEYDGGETLLRDFKKSFQELGLL